ncbi:MAG: pectinesterase family protein [Lachnospiraceae bacterium]
MKEVFVQQNISNPSVTGCFTTVTEAIRSLPSDGEWYIIKIAPGIYREKIYLNRSNTILSGLGNHPAETVLVYGDYALDRMPDGGRRGTFRSFSFLLDANNVTLRNLTIANDSGDETTKGQAIALYADGDHLFIENCRLLGRQDTLFTGPLPPKELQPGGFVGPKQFSPRINGHHLYRDCYICGNIDFIFGSATACFENCKIESLCLGKSGEIQGYVTAPSTPEGQKYGYVFRNCRFLSRECPPDSVYLGRPWRDYGQAVFMDCILGPHIRSEGFHDWNKEQARQSCYFATFRCKRPDNSPYHSTAPFSKELSSLEAESLINGLLPEVSFGES